VQHLLGDGPTAATLGRFTAGDANVRMTKTWAMAYFPFELMELLLGSKLTAHQVFELFVSALIYGGLEETCSGLIDFLNVALVIPSAAAPTPLTVHHQVGVAGYVPGPATISHWCEAVLHHNLPLIHPASSSLGVSDPYLLDVARGIHDMVMEARAEQNDRNGVRAEELRPKTVREWMGDYITDRLLLLCHYGSDDELPALYHAWGFHDQGVSERWGMQQAVESSCTRQDVPSTISK
jgi:hypothetical protein